MRQRHPQNPSGQPLPPFRRRGHPVGGRRHAHHARRAGAFRYGDSFKAPGTPILTFVWYTGPDETLGSYFLFRSHWSSSEQWYSYQAVTEIFDGNEDAARKFLLDLLSRLNRKSGNAGE